MTERAVVLVGGWAHPPQPMRHALTELLDALGYDVATVDTSADVPAAVALGCDLLVVGSCWFSMADARYSDAQRSSHAVGADGALTAVLDRLRSDGVPLLALHTAVICFDDWPGWSDWLGGSWDWATSWHPAPAALEVRRVAGSVIAFDDFTVVDELYQQVAVSDAVEVVAESDTHPLVWLHDHGIGRVAVSLLGHDERSLDDPTHRLLLRQLVRWLVQKSSN